MLRSARNCLPGSDIARILRLGRRNPGGRLYRAVGEAILVGNMVGKEEKSVGVVQTRTVRVVQQDEPLQLECGKTLGPIDVACETYGQLNEAGDNAILICHALSGNAHVAGYHSESDKKPGWWETMVGPGKGIDTNKYFVICSNFLGGCAGTTGPSSINPETGKPCGLDFPEEWRPERRAQLHAHRDAPKTESKKGRRKERKKNP